MQESLFTKYKLVLKNNFGKIFLLYFLLWIVYGLYKGILYVLGTETLFTTLQNDTLILVLMFIFEIPFIFLLVMFSVYILRKINEEKQIRKKLFYDTLKLFIYQLSLLLIITIFAYLYLFFDNILTMILFVIFSLISVFFFFVSYKHIKENNLLLGAGKIIKEITNKKALIFFLVLLIILIVFTLIIYGIIYLGILPETITLLIIPFILTTTIFYSLNI